MFAPAVNLNTPKALEPIAPPEMATGFYAAVPDLSLSCDESRCAGFHALYVWTFTGHDAKTGNPLQVRGWEQWELGDDLKVKASCGWYDADDYARQVAGP